MHPVPLSQGFGGGGPRAGSPPCSAQGVGALCREQPTYEAALDELCCLIRWDTAGTFCFYCWRKKIVLILISNGSAGSCFSQRKMLEEMFKRRVAPFRSARLLCLPARLGKAAGGPGAALALLPFTSSWHPPAAVRKVVPIPK